MQPHERLATAEMRQGSIGPDEGPVIEGAREQLDGDPKIAVVKRRQASLAIGGAHGRYWGGMDKQSNRENRARRSCTSVHGRQHQFGFCGS